MSTLLEALKELNKIDESCNIEEECEIDEALDVPQAELPVQLLGEGTVSDYLNNEVKKGSYIHIGYIRSVTPAGSFKGKFHKEKREVIRDESGKIVDRRIVPEYTDPLVRILKANEYYGRVGVSFDNKQNVQDYRAAQASNGIEKGAYRAGFVHSEEGITVVKNGKEAVQFEQHPSKAVQVKWWVSVDDEEFHEATKEEVANYLPEAQANELRNGREQKTMTNQETGEVVSQTFNNTLYLDQIYYIGTDSHGKLGRSVL